VASDYDGMREARDFIESRVGTSVKVAVVLGSGLSDVLQRFDVSERLGYREIPHWPVGTVAGHAGELVDCLKVTLYIGKTSSLYAL